VGFGKEFVEGRLGGVVADPDRGVRCRTFKAVGIDFGNHFCGIEGKVGEKVKTDAVGNSVDDFIEFGVVSRFPTL
jgi:hypothetical protein